MAVLVFTYVRVLLCTSKAFSLPVQANALLVHDVFAEALCNCCNLAAGSGAG